MSPGTAAPSSSTTTSTTPATSATTPTTTTSTTASTTAAAAAATTSTANNDPSSARSLLRTRKSASQLAQRLSPFSGIATAAAATSPSSSSSFSTTLFASSRPPNPSLSSTSTVVGRASYGYRLRNAVSSDSLRPSASHFSENGQRSSLLRRLSPGLAARVKLLDGANNNNKSKDNTNNKSSSPPPPSKNQAQQPCHPIGTTREEHLNKSEFRRLHRKQSSTRAHEKGRAWSGGNAASGRPDTAVPPKENDNDPRPVETLSYAGEINGAAEDNMAAVGGGGSDSQTMATSSGEIRGLSSGTATREPTDFERYLAKSAAAAAASNGSQAPPPPPKDSPGPDSNGSNALGLHRTESIYSFSKASFSNQLSQLTSITLPQPSSLESTISSITTAPAAVRALTGAAEQIQKWIDKASDVLGGLDAEDDVEWAAAGGREGLDEVDKAVSKFESLINVYVQAIENVQLREDVADVGADQLTSIVVDMESTLSNWTSVRSQLKGVKEQVELAMEWEELWSSVLGDVGLEVDNLGRLIFEMEEKRHNSAAVEAEPEPTSGLDINELETIVEETPANNGNPSNSGSKLNLPPVFPPTTSPGLDTNAASPQQPQDESSLLALFARMQPLRASLDFLPMRLSMFQSRAEKIFPSACEELEDRRKSLENGYKKLETDAEALRSELGEDRWIAVFRNAGKQAHKMCESVERSVSKLQEAIDGGIQHNNPTALAKRAENFEAKKVHYGSAIERVLFIIQKGINDRLTVNGEIIRLHEDLKARSESLQKQMKTMESLLDELNASKNQELRDSISTIVTIDSPATRSAIDTPESSPASSVVMSSGNFPSRRSSATGTTTSKTATTSKLKRYSGVPQPASGAKNQAPPRRSSFNRTSTSTTGSAANNKHLQPATTPRLRTASPSPAPTPRPSSRISSTPSRPADKRPAWNSSANTKDLDVGHNFKSLSSTTPSPHRKAPMHSHASRSISSSLPVRSPLSRDTSVSPAPGARPPSRLNRGVTSPSPTLDRSTASPAPKRPSIMDPPPYSKLRKPTTSTTQSTSSSSAAKTRQSFGGSSSMRSAAADPGSKDTSRPGTSLGHSSRRSSLLPMPKPKSGRESSIGNRPPWR